MPVFLGCGVGSIGDGGGDGWDRGGLDGGIRGWNERGQGAGGRGLLFCAELGLGLAAGLETVFWTGMVEMVKSGVKIC
jgi:hypothetical protein